MEYTVKGGKTPVIDTEFNPFAFGDEIQQRINDYKVLAVHARSVAERIPQERRDAYFQLIEYPFCASAAMNQKFLYAQKARLFVRHKLPAANEYARLSRNAYHEIETLTHTYNHELLQGKWDKMMDMAPRNLPVFQSSELPDEIIPQSEEPSIVWFEGDTIPSAPNSIKELPPFVEGSSRTAFVALFSKGEKQPGWKVTNKPEWLKIEEEDTELNSEKRLIVGIDWSKVCQNATSQCSLLVDGQKHEIIVSAICKPNGKKVEYNKMIAWNAADYDSRPVSSAGMPTEGLGYSEKAIPLSRGESVTYQVETFNRGECVVRVSLIPNHPTNGGQLRYEISVDYEVPQIVSYETVVRSEPWKINVLRNLSLNVTNHQISTPGIHTVRLKALDDGVNIDRLMLDFELQRSFYVIPVGSNK